MKKNKYSRQSFLGINSFDVLSKTTIAIVGLGGGGSHLAQQLAHVGIGRIKLFDRDRIEVSNLNRTIGSRFYHPFFKTPKVWNSYWLIRMINPKCKVQVHKKDWQQAALEIRDCDVVFGCIDSYTARRELEITCRRFLIPYIDIGMVVSKLDEQFSISGQVILSFPGDSCMRCMGFLRDDDLALEAGRYGDAGENPQVVWSNGILASTAVGIFVRLVTSWRENLYIHDSICLEYDGDRNTLTESAGLRLLKKGNCKHFPLSDCHDPNWIGYQADNNLSLPNNS